LRERGLDGFEEGGVDRVAFEYVGDVGGEAGFGVLVGEEADVGEVEAEDCLQSCEQGTGDSG